MAGLFIILAIASSVPAWVAALAAATALTVAFSIQASNLQTPDANLWVVGAGFLFVGTLLGGLVLVLLARALKPRA